MLGRNDRIALQTLVVKEQRRQGAPLAKGCRLDERMPWPSEYFVVNTEVRSSLAESFRSSSGRRAAAKFVDAPEERE